MAAPQTPQRPLPGAFFMTPAPSKQIQSTGAFQNPSISQPSMGSNTSQAPFQPQQTVTYPQISATAERPAAGNNPSKGLSQIERATRTINQTLNEEALYPALDTYISQGASNEYDIPTSPAWAPFQKVRMYDIPDKIFEQYNKAEVSTMMGLFAEINHAWISIDNALYLWDYTHPNPELVGFEEQPNSITAVKLVVPRPGVFVPAITKLLAVATTQDIYLIGVATQDSPTGSKQISLYQTQMTVPVRGLSITCIEGSSKTGRIFFAGRSDDNVYELTYQQEEKWFQSRCSKVNHTTQGFDSLLPTFFSSNKKEEYIKQLLVDDSRDLLYVLSSTSTIKAFQIRQPDQLNLAITRPLNAVLSDVIHRVGQSPLFGQDTSIVTLSAVSSQEASRINLIAVTSTGCRIFFSAVSVTSFGAASNAPNSMQVWHIKFPPKDASSTQVQSQTPQPQPGTFGAIMQPYQGAALGSDSKSLSLTRFSQRLAPGYFLCFVQKSEKANDILFMSAPDPARIARPQEPSQKDKFPEFGLWIQMESRAEDVGQITAAFGATSAPQGFGNELAVQFDKQATEIAVLTNSGVHTYRRRRLVDIFAAAIRYGGGSEGLEGEVKTFARLYGRAETIATALAVACGQGSDVTADSRVARVTDPELLERARKAFVEHGGKPQVEENIVADQGTSAIDNVRPSPRHDGLALYISRLLRSVWKAPIILEGTTPQGGLQVNPALPLPKLQTIQHELIRLQEFLNANKTFIEGLAGPDALGRVSTKQEEIALQGEHRALDSLTNLITNVIEGISFVLVLFDERTDEIILSISEQARTQVKQMTYERLFCTNEGKDLAKELVKAIVNRNIAHGSNVDTVTDALRRRCGSFCSTDDCVIFKAQEQLKRASDTNASSESSRNLLNESVKLLEKVAASLSTEQLQWAVEQYITQEFFAGAIRLVLKVAQENDRGNQALAWQNEGSPSTDNRSQLYETRTRCYNLVHQIILAVDRTASNSPQQIDGVWTVAAKRVREAYDEINNSNDELFQFNLYDWYLSQGQAERLLDIQSAYVISYLKRKSQEDIARADLLWRYYARYDDFLGAARVQCELAKSNFDLTLDQRVEYLSQARANASTKTSGASVSNYANNNNGQSRQELIRELGDLLDISSIQNELLSRFRSDPRLTASRRPQVLQALNGPILPLDDLYNGYADQAEFYDLCLLIYHCADHRNIADIRATWNNLIEQTHDRAEKTLSDPSSPDQIHPFEAVAEEVRTLGNKLQLSESTFPISALLPMLLKYAHEFQRHVGPPTWVIDMFIDLGVENDILFGVLEEIFYGDEVPFRGRNRRPIVIQILRVASKWFEDTAKSVGITTMSGSMRGSFRGSFSDGFGGRGTVELFGGDENAIAVKAALDDIAREPWDQQLTEQLRAFRQRIEQALGR